MEAEHYSEQFRGENAKALHDRIASNRTELAKLAACPTVTAFLRLECRAIAFELLRRATEAVSAAERLEAEFSG